MIVILVIAENQLQAWEGRCGCSIDNVGSRTPIVGARGRDEHSEKQTHAVRQDMALSPLDLLPPVVASVLAACRRRGDGLAIDYAQTGRRRTARLNPRLL